MESERKVISNNLDTVSISGRIGILDGALINYIKKIKGNKKRIAVYITESIYEDIIPKIHIEEFLKEASIIDKVLKRKSELKQLIQQKKATLTHFPEEILLRYSLERILKKVKLENKKNELEIGKLINLNEFIKYYDNNLKKRKQTIGLVSGSFDLIHLGHIRYIKQAKEIVDVLVIATMSTNSIKQQEKNILGDRPIYSLEDRLTVLTSLRSADYIIVFEELDCKEVIRTIKPNFFFKDQNDMSRQIVKEECALVTSLGGEIVVTNNNIGYSSTEIIKYIRNLNPTL